MRNTWKRRKRLITQDNLTAIKLPQKFWKTKKIGSRKILKHRFKPI